MSSSLVWGSAHYLCLPTSEISGHPPFSQSDLGPRLLLPSTPHPQNMSKGQSDQHSAGVRVAGPGEERAETKGRAEGKPGALWWLRLGLGDPVCFGIFTHIPVKKKRVSPSSVLLCLRRQITYYSEEVGIAPSHDHITGPGPTFIVDPRVLRSSYLQGSMG